jgi:hypothetical protein
MIIDFILYWFVVRWHVLLCRLSRDGHHDALHNVLKLDFCYLSVNRFLVLKFVKLWTIWLCFEICAASHLSLLDYLRYWVWTTHPEPVYKDFLKYVPLLFCFHRDSWPADCQMSSIFNLALSSPLSFPSGLHKRAPLPWFLTNQNMRLFVSSCVLKFLLLFDLDFFRSWLHFFVLFFFPCTQVELLVFCSSPLKWLVRGRFVIASGVQARHTLPWRSPIYSEPAVSVRLANRLP